jgi:hypothetical protein
MVHIGETSPEGFTPLTEVIASIWKLRVRRNTVTLKWSFGNVDIRMLRNAALDVEARKKGPSLHLRLLEESCISGSALSQACEPTDCSIFMH